MGSTNVDGGPEGLPLGEVVTIMTRDLCDAAVMAGRPIEVAPVSRCRTRRRLLAAGLLVALSWVVVSVLRLMRLHLDDYVLLVLAVLMAVVLAGDRPAP